MRVIYLFLFRTSRSEEFHSFPFFISVNFYRFVSVHKNSVDHFISGSYILPCLFKPTKEGTVGIINPVYQTKKQHMFRRSNTRHFFGPPFLTGFDVISGKPYRLSTVNTILRSEEPLGSRPMDFQTAQLMGMIGFRTCTTHFYTLPACLKEAEDVQQQHEEIRKSTVGDKNQTNSPSP